MNDKKIKGKIKATETTKSDAYKTVFRKSKVVS